MSNETITVFLADDHKVVREGLSLLLSKQPEISIIGECGDGLRVIEHVDRLQPDILILDITMPGFNGLAICEKLSQKVPDTSVIILTMHSNEEFVVEALENGACGYLLKDSASDDILNAISAAMKGELFIGTGISKNIVTKLNKANPDPYKLLTEREKQVLQLAAEGQSKRQIAKQLSIAYKTVDTHRNRLMKKLDIHNQTDLVKFAIRKGIITL